MVRPQVESDSTHVPADEVAGPQRRAGAAATRWLVSTRPSGEVLTADITHCGLRLVVIGGLRSPRCGGVEARLQAEIGAALDSARRDTGPHPLPGYLHHTLASLADQLAELDGDGVEPAPGAIVLFESERAVAFAHVGGTEPRIEVDGRPFDVRWVVVRTERGHEARGSSMYARRGLRVALEWSWPAGGGAAQATTVTAQWLNPAAASATERGAGGEVRGASVGKGSTSGMAGEVRIEGATGIGSEEASPSAPAFRSGKFFRWLDRMVGGGEERQSTSAETVSGGAPAGAIDLTPLSPEPPGLSERAAEPAHASPPAPAESPRPIGPRPRAPRRPAWPQPERRRSRGSSLLRAVPTVLFVVVLFAGGWLLGRVQGSGPEPVSAARGVARALGWLGLGAGRYQCTIRSWPAGAWISIDGKELARRAPAMVELVPGPHEVGLTLPGLGNATFTVRGGRGEKTTLDAPLWGSLTIHADETAAPIQVSVDGGTRGIAPLTLRHLTPGPHVVQFSGYGLEPWGQTIEVRVRQSSELTARPFLSPATGLVEVQASLADDRGTEPLKGATVWVNGARAGVTPLKLELPRGPHSIRAEYRGEELPVQLIDLPGGNQRFANFQFATGVDRPRLTLLSSTGPMPRDRPTVVSVTLEGVSAGEVSEMWLHVRTPEGPWRRYPMTTLAAAGGTVGVAGFPLALLDASGRAPYYASALSTMGDEYFTELQNVEGARSAPRRQ